MTPVSAAPLEIGPLRVDPPVVLAPMAGVTNVGFRTLCRSFGAGLYVNEMVTARALVEGNDRTRRMLTFGDDEPVRSAQLYGVDPDVVGKAVRLLVDDAGVDHIDLNFGCPVAKVTRKGGGAALPAHRALFRAVVRSAVRAAGPVPVTVKLRIGIDDTHHTFLSAGIAAEEEGAAAVALHARTAEQLYAGSARWAAIAELKQAVTRIPVLGNGDIWEADDALTMMAETGCDGVVIGRGCLGRPWLFRDLTAAFSGQPRPPVPNLGEVIAVMRTHALRLSDLAGEKVGITQFRRHVSWYLTGFPVGSQRRKSMALVESLADLDSHLAQLDPTVAFPPEAHRMARGHTHGPRPVALPDGWLDDLDDLTPPVGADIFTSGG